MIQQSQQNKIQKGLRPLKKDSRDFKLGSLFKPVNLSEIPDEFIVGKTEILDQGGSDFCTAFSSSAASSLQENEVLSPEYSFALSKKLSGDIGEWGQDLRTALKVHVQFGAITKAIAQFNLTNKDNDFLRDIRNWPNLLPCAELHKKQSYFSVDYGLDTFNNIRVALWQNRDKKCLVVTGCIWRSNWTYAKDGIIPKEYGDTGFGHAFIIVGTKKIGDEIYLVAQLSNGTDIGDAGYFYFSREVVNKCFTFGAFCFLDLNPDEIKKEVWPMHVRVWEAIKNYFSIIWI